MVAITPAMTVQIIPAIATTSMAITKVAFYRGCLLAITPATTLTSMAPTMVLTILPFTKRRNGVAFVWVQDISSGAVIDAVDASEIRTNVDTVDNEKCAAEKVADQSTNYPSYCNDEHTGYLSNDHGTYYSGYLSGYDSTDNPSVRISEKTSYYSGELSGYDAYQWVNFKGYHYATV
ncbi:hypothetical protein ES703_66716 [subsurface metagenome]